MSGVVSTRGTQVMQAVLGGASNVAVAAARARQCLLGLPWLAVRRLLFYVAASPFPM